MTNIMQGMYTQVRNVYSVSSLSCISIIVTLYGNNAHTFCMTLYKQNMTLKTKIIGLAAIASVDDTCMETAGP